MNILLHGLQISKYEGAISNSYHLPHRVLIRGGAKERISSKQMKEITVRPPTALPRPMIMPMSKPWLPMDSRLMPLSRARVDVEAIKQTVYRLFDLTPDEITLGLVVLC